MAEIYGAEMGLGTRDNNGSLLLTGPRGEMTICVVVVVVVHWYPE